MALNLYNLLFFSSLLLPPHLARPDASPTPEPSFDDGEDIQDYLISAPSDSETLIESDLSPSSAPSPGVDINPKLKKICDSTDYPSLCVAMVSPYLDGEADVMSVLDVAIQAGARFSKYGQAMAQKLAGSGNPAQMNSALSECKDSFESAVDNYGKAMDSLPEQDKGTIKSMLSAVITAIGDCQEKISQDSELYNITDRLMNMTSNCLAICSLMN